MGHNVLGVVRLVTDKPTAKRQARGLCLVNQNLEVCEEPNFDEYGNTGEEELVEGDTGLLLVVRSSCLTPRATGDDWLRNNIFLSTCIIRGKVYRFVINIGSCENIVYEETMQKLGVKT